MRTRRGSVVARKTDYVGDRFGDWVVMSKAPAVDGKRFWNVTNSQTDETAIVAQVNLKKLGDKKFFPSTESFLSELETGVAHSAEITRKVLIGNGEYNAFDYPGTDPDDPDDYPFAVEFIEPDVVATVTGADGQTDVYLSDGTVVIGDNPFDNILDTAAIMCGSSYTAENPFETQMSAGFDDDDDDDFGGLASWAAKQDIGLDDVSASGPSEDARNAAALKVATDFSDALVDAIADHFQSFISEWRAIAKEEIAGQLTVMAKSGE
jgi:hypothetical protein